jgi:heme exporter protein A
MTTERPIIEIENLVKAYDFFPVLRQLSLTVQRGQFVALLGPNGSGKSTLLRLLAALSKPTSGLIRVGGWEIPDEAQQIRAQIGMVSHKSLLYENLTARENLLFFGSLYDIPKADCEARADDMLKQVGLKKRARSLVRTFSRGMQQRLSIARALLPNPHVLLFDEPYTGLDQDAGNVLDALLRTAHNDQRTILMATHQIERAARLVDRVVILNRGVVAYDALMQDIPDATLPSIYAEVTGKIAPE